MEETRVNLIIPRGEALAMISGHIEKGKKLLEAPISNDAELKNVKALYHKWRDYAQEILIRIFNNDSEANKLNRGGRVISMNTPFHELVTRYRNDFDRDITNLESVEERLPLIFEPEGAEILSKQITKDRSMSKRVFVVHGHDAAAKLEVARFIEHLGLEPIILHEQANEGKTLIEKFEAHSKGARYALIILSPDDLGSVADDPTNAQPRARQNVVFEWGYFLGRLGRDRVNALYFEGVELPTDNDGVVYTPFDSKGAWKILAARELKQAGYQIDLNDLV